MDHEPSQSNEHIFDISQRELEATYISLAEALIMRGKEDYIDNVIEQPDQPTPHEFTVTLNPRDVRDIFFRGDDAVIPVEGYATYLQPHVMHEPPHDQAIQTVLVALTSRLRDTDIFMSTYYMISMDEQVQNRYHGEIETQYSQWESESPYISSTKRPSMRPKRFEEQFRINYSRYTAGVRELMLDDVDVLRKLSDYIQSLPRQR